MRSADVDVFILCGGLGSRLGTALADQPKALAPIGNRTFLDILIGRCAAAGARRFVLCVGHKAGAIEGHMRSDASREIVFSRETSPLGTGGALALAAPLRRTETSLVFNGDSLCPFDPDMLLAAHTRPIATLAVVDAGARTDGGFIALAPDGAIARFSEKTDSARYVNAGVYALGPAFWDALPAGRPSSLETEVFPSLVGRGLRGWVTDAPLYDIGTPERLEAFRRVDARSPF